MSTSARPCPPRARAALAAALLAVAFAVPLAPAPVAAAPTPAAARAGAPAVAGAPWYQGGVIYGVAPGLFGHRPLRDLTARLDDLAALGVKALWLAPVTVTDDDGGISYAVTDYFHLRPDFGTEEDLRALVRAAHARGLRVLLDVVPNHTSTGHPWFRDAEARGPASPWYRFYLRDAQGRTTWDFDWKNLRKLDYGQPAVRQVMTEAFTYWVRAFDVDGFRVDAAWGVRQRTPDFWPELAATLRRIRPDLFLLAEAGARDGYYLQAGFDAAYDWTDELGHWAWEALWDHPERIGPALDAALAPRGTPMDRVARFLDNNDTGDRFVTRHGLATTRLATVLLHTLPGIPVLYTGEEVCAAYRPYEQAAPLPWADRCGLRPLLRRLIALRAGVPALATGQYRRVPTPGQDDAFAFARDAGAAGQALVVLNFGAARRVRLEWPAGAAPSWDALSGRAADLRPVDGGLELALPAQGAAVLVAGPAAVPAAAGRPPRPGRDQPARRPRPTGQLTPVPASPQ